MSKQYKHITENVDLQKTEKRARDAKAVLEKDAAVMVRL